MLDASHDAGCQETSLGRHKRPSMKGTAPQHTLDPLPLIIIIIILLLLLLLSLLSLHIGLGYFCRSLSELMDLWLAKIVHNFLGSLALIPILGISIKI